MPYTQDKPPLPESSDQLRARIPGWGADLDPHDRPSVPRERFDPGATGAHWDFPDRQPELHPRERSVEHAQLTPVFGTSAPLHGLSGSLRRLAYARYSEARAAHWLILIAADRVDAAGSHVRSVFSAHPDNPLTETGIRAELTHHGYASRAGSRRVDVRHQPADVLVVGLPWVLAVGGSALVVRSLVRRLR
ncbi:hypothetical protein [uncultured Cellulomonas sp.]|uniref:hypothetical protein n=1 Tax=uncultured Cellulomonas sp. TaxID=189682 RepID=UPI0028E37E88|nr:hypothetical protein [uncultured Cellulomonas sp.]